MQTRIVLEDIRTWQNKQLKEEMARKSKYNQKIVNRITDLIKRDSYSVVEICQMVGISHETFFEWQRSKPDFSDAVKRARGEFDELLVHEAKNSLRKLVNGYDVDEKKTVYTEGRDGKPKIKEQTTTKKHFQPNVAATIFLLTNKAPDEFKNKQFNEVTGKDGKDIIPNIQIEIIDNREQVETTNDEDIQQG